MVLIAKYLKNMFVIILFEFKVLYDINKNTFVNFHLYCNIIQIISYTIELGIKFNLFLL